MVFFDSAEVKVIKAEETQTTVEPPVVLAAEEKEVSYPPMEPVVDWGYSPMDYCCDKATGPTVEHMVCICVGVALGYFVTKILTTTQQE